MSFLERLNDWCEDLLDSLMRYDALLTMCFFSLMGLMIIIAIVGASGGFN
jgi:hypothetical protein